MPSATGHQKAFSTCSSHFIVVSLFYGTASLTYLRAKSNQSPESKKLVSLSYTVITPMLNPIIYSLRNNETKGAVKRTITRKVLQKLDVLWIQLWSSSSKQNRSTRTHEQKLQRSGRFVLTLSGSLTMMGKSQCLSQSPSSDWGNRVLLWRDYSQIVGQLIWWKFHVSWPERQRKEVLTGALENAKNLRKSCSLEAFCFSRERQQSQPNSALTLLHLLLVSSWSNQVEIEGKSVHWCNIMNNLLEHRSEWKKLWRVNENICHKPLYILH